MLNNLTLGDDFDSTSRIKTDTLSFLYAHRLTPDLTLANASYAIERSEGTGYSNASSQYTLTLGISTQLGRRTSGSVQCAPPPLHQWFEPVLRERIGR